jgi:PAS domain S-box-containing protein
MKDERKTKVQLIDEIAALRRQVAEFEASGAERKQVEEALKDSEQHHRVLIDMVSHLGEGIIIAHDYEGKRGDIAFINDTVTRILGYAREELLQMCLRDLVAPASIQDVAERYLYRQAGDRTEEHYESVALAKDGREVPLQIETGNTIYQGMPAIVAFIRDITERKRMEKMLRRSEEHFRSLIENLSDVILIMDADGTISYIGPSVRRVLGYEPKERTGISGFDLIHPDDLPVVIDAFSRSVQTQGFHEPIEMRIRHKDGSWRVVQGVGNNLLGNPSVAGMVVNFRDITDQKSAEEALKESEEKYRAIFDNALDGIVLVDSQTGYIIECNAAFEKQTGRRIGKLRKMKIWETRPPEQQKAAKQKFLEINEQGYGSSSELDFLKPNGVIVSIEFVSRKVMIEGREYLLGMCRDITERKYSEERIRNQKELLESTLESLTHPFYVVNVEDYSIEMANSAARLGKAMANQKCYTLIHGCDEPCSELEHPCPLEQLKNTGSPVTVEHVLCNEYGIRKNIEVHGYPVFDKEGKVIRMITYYIDITERKKLDQLKDDFISLVSHELRSPLTVITGAINTVLTEGDRLSEEEINQLITDAAIETDVLSHLLSNLLELSRAQADRLRIFSESVSIARIIQDTVMEIKRRSPSHRFTLNIPRRLPVVLADQLRLERVIYNLLDNAVKYSPQGGYVRVSVKPEEGSLVVSIKDKGAGISLNDQTKLFEPFQRIEDSRLEGIRGSGLGLLVCRRLVEAHGGQIWVESKPGKGSTFFFTVPIVTE